MQFEHEPVLLNEVLEILDPQPGRVFVDGTVGGAGHSREIIRRLLPGGRLIAVDQDQEALAAARVALASYSGHVVFVHRNFRDIKRILEELSIEGVDGILLDVGVSSHQVDTDERGFTYHGEAPLDMRMDRSLPLSAADLVNTWSEEELARIIRDFGEELWARRIAAFIVARRKDKGPFTNAGELVEVIKNAIPARARRRGPHPARRTFQALRIAVNDELGALETAVRDGMECLRVNGRLAVISFHSLEDRIVKKAFQNAAAGCQCPPGLPMCVCGRQPMVRILTPKPVIASDEEISRNQRARSAKLRAVQKVLNAGEGE